MDVGYPKRQARDKAVEELRLIERLIDATDRLEGQLKRRRRFPWKTY
jgi:hypothetical protein